MGDTPAVAPGTGPLAPEFNGIDPVLMRDFIADLERAGQVIAEHTEAIRRELAAVDLPAAASHRSGRSAAGPRNSFRDSGSGWRPSRPRPPYCSEAG
ncbi:hypothetical protein ACFQX6_64210 [Streptosporangium lutulentum]